MNLRVFTICALAVLMAATNAFSRQYFNKSKDLLLANFDLRPDEDDVMAAAGLACMLRHPDLAGVDYYVVAGAYGKQGGSYITSAVPNFYNSLFGAQNQRWTHAHTDWNGSVNRVAIKVRAILNNGGKVFVQEAGQSDFTHDMLKKVISDGVAASVVKSRVIVVQHSDWNENQATQWKLNWVRSNTDYNKIADGNGNNATPQYNLRQTTWLNQARSSSNPNAAARSFWTQADNICRNWNASWENPTIANGGVDFSDCVENWWIFNIGDKANNVSKFWSRYVTNGNSGGGGGDPVVTMRKGNSNFAIDGNNGGANEQNVYLWSYSASNVNQQWVEVSRGSGFYSYKKRNTNYCLDGGVGGQNGQNVKLYTCGTSNQNQHWKKVNIGGGKYRLQT